MGKLSRWLIIIPAILFALFAKPAKADTLGEWAYSQSCPTSGSVEVIDDTIILHGPDQGGCSGAAHWVKIETTIPADVDTIDFTWSYQTTDGWVYDPPQYGINGVYTLITQQNNATGSLSVPVQEGDVFTFRQYSIDTCCAPGHLTIANLSLWASITTSTTSTTTSTTTVPTTTVPATVPTTTTVPETSTSSSTTTTSTTSTTSSTTSTTTTSTTVLPATSTSSSTTSTTSTTSTSSTTTSSTTTSSVPQTTSSVSVPTTTLPPEPSTSTEPPQIYEPEPTEPYVPEEPEITETGTTTTVVEEPIQEETPLEETTTTTELSPEETYPETTEPAVVDTTPETTDPEVEDTTPETLPDAPLSEEEVTSILEEATTTEELVEALADLSPEQVSQVIEEILAEEPTQEQAAALATSPDVLAVVSAQEAEQIFEALDVAELTDAQTEQLIEAIESAPLEIREEFEDTINIFGEGLDDYTPVGSTIPVGERRTLIAVTAGITLAAAGTRIRR